ncbi:MAG: glutamate-1-semialdehyde 2,1-aminomutase [Planctomycetes bacterium]|nr:glutamate-1-semialdehyde 2,1-aminomutase [Planctomycetota bacterium]
MTTEDRNATLFERARQLLPGGVSSPVRAFRAVGGTPRFVESAHGARFVDANGDEYLDFVQSWGPLILGHAHPEVLARLGEVAARGLTFGAPHRGELELAERICAAYPGVERVRFTSSGTEATMSAIRLARGVTGRDRLLKFSGCYHGHSDGLLVAAGSGAITFGEPSSRGVPAAVAQLTSVLPLDDEAALEQYFAAHGAETAAVIVEPIPANNGLLLQRCEWLRRLAGLAHEHGALLIWDEVISGFRVGMAGAAGIYGITPDLVTFGKIVGGGLPCGAFAGPAVHLDNLAPLGRVYQAGTLSGNPLAMAAGAKTLEILHRDEVHATLNLHGRRLEQGVRTLLADHAHWRASFVRIGSIFWLAFGARDSAPRSAETIAPEAAQLYATFFGACLRRHVYLAPSAYEVGFLSTAHTEADIDRAVAVFGEAMAETFGG